MSAWLLAWLSLHILHPARCSSGQQYCMSACALLPGRTPCRLDKLTSGALVLATSREAAGELVAQFRGRGVHKYYVALSERKPAKKMGSIVGDMQARGSSVCMVCSRSAPTQPAELPQAAPACRLVLPSLPPRGLLMIPLHFLSPLPYLQRGRRGSWMLSRGTQNPSITRFTSAAVAGCDGRPLRAFLLKPVTGRTHQLRVAMKSLGAPVLGDEVCKGSRRAGMAG